MDKKSNDVKKKNNKKVTVKDLKSLKKNKGGVVAAKTYREDAAKQYTED